VSALLGFVSSIVSMIRWAEPWDIELDDDPLLERSHTEHAWG